MTDGAPDPSGIRVFHVLLGDVDEEVRVGFLVGLLEIAVGLYRGEAGLADQLAGVVLAQWEHVQPEVRSVRERVPEARESFVDMFRLGDHIVPDVVVLVLRRETVIENRVVVALVEDQDPVDRVERGRLMPEAYERKIARVRSELQQDDAPHWQAFVAAWDETDSV